MLAPLDVPPLYFPAIFRCLTSLKVLDESLQRRKVRSFGSNKLFVVMHPEFTSIFLRIARALAVARAVLKGARLKALMNCAIRTLAEPLGPRRCRQTRCSQHESTAHSKLKARAMHASPHHRHEPSRLEMPGTAGPAQWLVPEKKAALLHWYPM